MFNSDSLCRYNFALILSTSSGKSKEGPEASENVFVGHLSNHSGPVSSIIPCPMLDFLYDSHCFVGNLVITVSIMLFLIFQVRGLEFNVFTSNLLASGADEGKICIWDIANPGEPTHYPPLKVGSNLRWKIKSLQAFVVTTVLRTMIIFLPTPNFLKTKAAKRKLN